MKILEHIEHFFSTIKSLFLNGLFTILPITATVFFVHFTYTTLLRWLAPLKQIEPVFLQHIPGSELIVVTLLIFLIGAFIKLFVISPLIHKIENIIDRIPLIRSIYSSAKTMVNFFNVPASSRATRKVVLIEFPKKGFYNIAFLLESAENNFSKVLPEKAKTDGKKYFKVFMPNSPTPTSGYFFVLPEDELIHTDITFEEAIKAIVSCGLITPDTIRRIK